MQQNTGTHRAIRPVAKAQPGLVEPHLVDETDVPADPPLLRKGRLRQRGASRRHYLPVQAKFALAFIVSILWTVVSTLLALPWLQDLAAIVSWPVAVF